MIKGYPSSQAKGPQKYQTLQPLGSGKHASDALMAGMTDLAGIDLVPEATSTGQQIDLAGHTVKAGEMIRFTGGTLDGQEAAVLSVDANSILLGHDFGAIAVTDVFRNFSSRTLALAADGSIPTSQGPLQFRLDGGVQEVTEDTGTPANNAPLPVKLTGVTGDVNITAGDLNVQTSHLGASFDSQRIGDGVTELGIIPVTKEAKVHDTDALVELQGIVAELQKELHILDSQYSASQALDITTGVSIATVPASKVATELEISYKNGDTISVHDAATGGNLIGYITSGGGTLKLNKLAATTVLYARAAVNFSAIDLVTNLNGKDA